MAPVVTMRQLLEAGVHFGHQTRRWNPKMKRFIHGERNGIYLIDLRQTLSRIEDSYTFARDLVADGGTVLFVGTKKQAQDSVQSYAEKCGMPYINQRWLGGMLTNFQTISKRVAKMKEYQRMRDSGEFEAMPKKEALLLNRELTKLERNLYGIRNMEVLPQAVFVLDTKIEDIAVTEANKLKIPLIAVVDTNCDPDVVQYVIPGNDDAIRSGDLMCRILADACLEGRFMASRSGVADAGGPEPRSAEDEKAHADQQAAARDAAMQAAREREARVVDGATPAASPAEPASASPPVPPPPPLAEVAPNPEPAPAASPAEPASASPPVPPPPPVAEVAPATEPAAAPSAEPASTSPPVPSAPPVAEVAPATEPAAAPSAEPASTSPPVPSAPPVAETAPAAGAAADPDPTPAPASEPAAAPEVTDGEGAG